MGSFTTAWDDFLDVIKWVAVALLVAAALGLLIWLYGLWQKANAARDNARADAMQAQLGKGPNIGGISGGYRRNRGSRRGFPLRYY